jgi:hypothetical protein
MEWLPIESAPKDGTPVLLGGGEFDCDERGEGLRHPVVAAWHQGNGWDPNATFWLIASTEGGLVSVVYTNPTHWTPIPPGP